MFLLHLSSFRKGKMNQRKTKFEVFASDCWKYIFGNYVYSLRNRFVADGLQPFPHYLRLVKCKVE